MEGFEYVDHLQRLDLEPGDVLVVHSKAYSTMEVAERIKAQFRDVLPGVKVLVVFGDLDLAAVRSASLGET